MFNYMEAPRLSPPIFLAWLSSLLDPEADCMKKSSALLVVVTELHLKSSVIQSCLLCTSACGRKSHGF